MTQGFLRGAYQVRALAGMIARVDDGESNVAGLPAEIDALLKSYKSWKTKLFSSKKSHHAEVAEAFKNMFCNENVRIHFVGVWDTISSIGIGRNRTLPCTTSSCEHICYFRHALALDERRVGFLPEYAFGGRSETINDEYIKEAWFAATDSDRVDDHIKEVWFVGTHSDVGGGNRSNTKLRSGDIPLLWMRSQAAAAGLHLKPADFQWTISDLEKPITPSLRWGWWFLELLPLKRLLYYNSERKTHKWVPIALSGHLFSLSAGLIWAVHGLSFLDRKSTFQYCSSTTTGCMPKYTDPLRSD
ncbi:hypothetical protein BU15DRAFT_53085 [Melanogaster broomeanus]|nr:hypothetical protein BU15DRAFT_53085 [Melanogaster broomeanus]